MPDPIDDDLAALAFETGVRQRGTEPDAGTDDHSEAAESALHEAAPAPSARRRAARFARPTLTAGSRRSIRRQLVSLGVLVAALVGVGGAYMAIAEASNDSGAQSSADQVAEGRALFAGACITCHGANLQGVTDRGPSLIGTGGAATYFQVATGRMPLDGQDAEARRHGVHYTQAQIQALVAYVQSMGGGPTVPNGDLSSLNDLGKGGEIFRLNCAQCHGATGRGGALSAGKSAPGLGAATDLQIWTAMLSGPESMPVFSDNQLTPDQKRDLIGYIQSLKSSKDPGGQGLDRIGPVSEGIVAWVAGIGAVIAIILWIGRKAGA